MPESREIPATQRFAWILGLAGLLPFLGHALFSWLSPPNEAVAVLRSHVAYAASVLTFLGALHWGVTLASPTIVDGAAALRMVWSVIPSIFAWLVPLYSTGTALPAMVGGLAVALAVDLLLYRGTPVPRWFPTLRVVLSVGALAALGASWLAMSVRFGGVVR